MSINIETHIYVYISVMKIPFFSLENEYYTPTSPTESTVRKNPNGDPPFALPSVVKGIQIWQGKLYWPIPTLIPIKFCGG